MTIALLSDIHANLPALESVLADLDARKPDAAYCLGDLVGYAPWPNEVIDLIRARNIPTLKGNYDEGVGLSSDDCGCAYKTEEEKAAGKISIALTNQWVTEERKKYLRELPARIPVELKFSSEDFHLLLVHGSPRKINEYLFEDREEKSLLRIVKDANADLLAFGHTHKPWHRILQDGEIFRHAVNTGSVGKPKDGDPRASYVLLHFNDGSSRAKKDSIKIEFVRVKYDVEKAAKEIEKTELPNVFADMLRKAY